MQDDNRRIGAVGALLMDEEEVIEQVTPELADFLGRSADGLRGVRVDDVLPAGLALDRVAVRRADGARRVLASASSTSPPGGGALELAGAAESPAGVWIKDAAGRYVSVNAIWSDQAHVPAEAVLGRTDSELPPEHRADGAREVMAGEPTDLEYRVEALGSRTALWTCRVALRDQAGVHQGTLGVATPASRAELARRECQKLIAHRATGGGSREDMVAASLATWGLEVLGEPVEPPAGLAEGPAGPTGETTPAEPLAPAPEAAPDPEPPAPDAELAAERDAAWAELGELEEELAQARDHHAGELSEMRARHAGELADLRERHAAELTTTRDELAETREELATAREAHAAELADRESELESARSGYERESSELARVRAEVGRLETELTSARARSPDLREDVESLHAERAELESTLATVRAERAELASDLAVARSECDASREELATARQLVADERVRAAQTVTAARSALAVLRDGLGGA